MTDVVRFTILGLALGAIYVLLAFGLVVIYRVSGIVNFAHVATAITAGYVYQDVRSRGESFIAGFTIAIVVALLIAVLSEALIISRLQAASQLTKLVASLGLLIVLQSALTLRYGSDTTSVPTFLPHNVVHILGTAISVDYLIVLGLCLVTAATLGFVYRRTTFGIATSALAENEIVFLTLGRSRAATSLVNWGIGGVLAGVAGVLVAPITQLQSSQATSLLIPVLAVALFGGLRSLPLTLAGGMLLGVVQSLLTKYGSSGVLVHLSGLSDAAPFLMIVFVLVLRGRAIHARGSTESRLPSVGGGSAPWPVVTGAALAIVLLILYLPNPWVVAITTALIASILILSFVVTGGYAGQLSLAQASLASVAALVAAHLAKDLSMPFVFACALGVLAAVPIGVIIGLPAIRTRGITLAIITLGLAAALDQMLFNRQDVTDAAQGGISVGTPSIFGLDLDEGSRPARYAFFALIVLSLVGMGVRNLRRSAVGRQLLCVRDNESAAASLGVNVSWVKLYAFAVGTAIAGVAGTLSAFRNPFVLFDGNSAFRGINSVAESVVGGVGYVSGSFVGSSMEPAGVGDKIVSNIGFGSWLPLIGGVLVIVTVVGSPDGVVPNVVRLFVPLRLRRAPGKPSPPAPSTVAQPVPSPTQRCRLEVRDVGVSFGGVKALSGVGFTVSSGEVLGVIGSNGAGKTTLIDVITGYTRPLHGRVLLDGTDITSASPHAHSQRGVTRSFQSIELFEQLTVRDNLLVASTPVRRWDWLINLVHVRRPILSDVASAASTEFDLWPDLDRYPHDLSYGRRRLLGISRAVATRPRVLLLDEPAAGLSENDRAELFRLIRRLAAEWNMAIILVEHDVELLMSVSDQVVALDFGQVIAAGVPEVVRNDAEVIRVYLGEASVVAYEPDSADRDVAIGLEPVQTLDSRGTA